MKADQLVRLIDKLVEKKLNATIRQIIKEEISAEVNKAMGRVLVEMVKEVKKSPTITEETNVEEQRPIAQINTKNSKLNSVLAETARNFKPLQRTADSGMIAELMDGGFDKIGMDENVSYSELSAPTPRANVIEPDGTNVGFLKSIVSEGVTTGQQQSVLGTSAVPDVLKGVFKKDFRAVLKKMDEQKKFGSSGMIDPRTVLSS